MKQTLRTIKSYVRREGRITVGQAQALEKNWTEYGLDFEGQVVDPTVLYGRSAPWVLEIGFGNGQHLLGLAEAYPENNYLGLDVYRPGAGALIVSAQAKGLSHLKVACHDAVEFVREALPKEGLHAIYIICPDPWPKRRHHKRRLLQTKFVQSLSSCLAVGGQLYLATDHAEYANWIQALMPAFDELEPVKYSQETAVRIAATKYAKRGERLQHALWIGVFSKRQ